MARAVSKLESGVLSADLRIDKVSVLVSLFDEAKKNIEVAQMGLERCKKIVALLEASLDYENGGVVANNLGKLYRYCLVRLGGLEEALEILGGLGESWKEIGKGKSN